MSTNIMINKSHIIDSSNSSFTYRCPSELHLAEGDKIAISKLNVFYSWFNISAKHQNNKINIKWWDSAGVLADTYVCTVSDGYYSLGTLNEYLMDFMTRNHLYMISADGKSNVYFIELRANSSTYQIELVYNSLAKSYTDGSAEASETWFTKPAAATWIPPINYEIPQLFVPNFSKFGLLIGQPEGAIVPAIVPASDAEVGAKYSIGSVFAPEMEPSTSFYVTSNVVSNPMSIPNNLLDSFTLTGDAQFGQMMSPLANERVWSRCVPGQYSEIKVQIYDQDFNPLQIRDPNILLILSIVH